MLKHLIIIILLSIAAIFFLADLSTAMMHVAHSFTYVTSYINSWLPQTHNVAFVIRILLLVGIPFVFTAIFSFLYSALIKKRFPFINELLWASWLILLLAAAR